MSPADEQVLLRQAYSALEELLGREAGLELRSLPGASNSQGPDAFWEIRDGPSEFVVTVLVEAFSRFAPRSLDRLSLSVAKLERLDNPTVLIVAPWLSARSQAVIAERGWSYLDLTGNVFVRVRRPTIYVRLAGAATDPQPRRRSEVRMRGAEVNGLVRLLVDVKPPYRMVDLAKASGLSKGYISRTLTALHEQGLIERSGSGPVTDVDWQGLLRFRAQQYDLMKTNRSDTYVARSGLSNLIRRISGDSSVIITGSFAATEVAAIGMPAQLAMYVPSAMSEFAKAYELYPSATGANIVLLQPSSESQIERPRLARDGTYHVGYSQLVQDLLTGNGRLPQEGEAVLEWLAENPGWRLDKLEQLGIKGLADR